MPQHSKPAFFCSALSLAAFFCFIAIAPALGQQAPPRSASVPHLLHRPQNPATPTTSSDKTAANISQPCTLPADVSGEYAFDRNNESIELDIDRVQDQCTVSGYITRLGDENTDKTTPLTYFFSNASVNGSQLRFATKVVHGIWYSFTGTILRGRSLAREDQGYYVLHGELSVHPAGDSATTAPQVDERIVNYKSLGRYASQ